MTPRPKIAETEVAKPVVAWLRDQHWDVHQEVAPGGGGSARADIVGVQGKALYVVETKVAFSLAVVEQAMGWIRSAHYVSIAVPSWAVNYKSGRAVLEFVCAHHGIGILEVHGLDGRYASGIRVDVHRSPRLNRHARDHFVRKVLGEETRTWAEAGAQTSRFFTPFAKTCDAIGRALAGRAEPITTRDLVKSIEHHYSTDASARGALPAWLRSGKIPGVVPVPDSKPEAWRWDDASYRAAKKAGAA